MAIAAVISVILILAVFSFFAQRQNLSAVKYWAFPFGAILPWLLFWILDGYVLQEELNENRDNLMMVCRFLTAGSGLLCLVLSLPLGLMVWKNYSPAGRMLAPCVISLVPALLLHAAFCYLYLQPGWDYEIPRHFSIDDGYLELPLPTPHLN